MKLKELLKHHNIAWPSNATHLFNFQYTDWEHSLVERPSKE